MDELEASLVIHRPPEEVYPLLFEFTNYRRYSEYVEDVTIRGEGVGSRFALTFAWWRLTYTLRGRVTDVDPPERIEFVITRDVDARGHWVIEPDPGAAPPDVETATRARLRIRFDPGSISPGAVPLPRFVSTSWVLDRVTPLVRPEGERIARRAVADIEGEPRDVDLEVHTSPDGV